MNNRLATIKYPTQEDAHMIDVSQKVKTVFNEDYPFLNKSFGYRLAHNIIAFIAMTIGGILLFFLIGARVKGRKIYRKNKKLFKKGAVIVCNHIHIWDTIIIMSAIRYRKIYYPAWEENLRGSNRFLIRFSGGIPVTTYLKALPKMRDAFNELLSKGKTIHFFPEGSMWWYNTKLRTFKKGAFQMAVENNVPILPLAFSYRPPTGLYRLFGRKDSLLTLNIGESVFPPDKKDFNNEKERILFFRDKVWNICNDMSTKQSKADKYNID